MGRGDIQLETPQHADEVIRGVKKTERKQDGLQQVNRHQVDEVFDTGADLALQFVEAESLPEADRAVAQAVRIEVIAVLEANHVGFEVFDTGAVVLQLPVEKQVIDTAIGRHREP